MVSFASRLLHAHKLTAYQLAKQSEGRISLSTAYRLNRSGGRAQNYDSDLLEAMCDVFNLRDSNVLFERDEAEKRGKRG